MWALLLNWVMRAGVIRRKKGSTTMEKSPITYLSCQNKPNTLAQHIHRYSTSLFDAEKLLSQNWIFISNHFSNEYALFQVQLLISWCNILTLQTFLHEAFLAMQVLAREEVSVLACFSKGKKWWFVHETIFIFHLFLRPFSLAVSCANAMRQKFHST